MFHPASLLLAWAAFAVLLPSLPLAVLGGLLLPALTIALFAARRRTLALLRRSRWLLVSIAILFAFATPGLLVPGWFGQVGMTQDGVALAAEHLARLVLLLATLALLHERLGSTGFVSGLYWLMTPLGQWRNLRERIVVRLMLVVEKVESGKNLGWRHWLDEIDDGEPSHLEIAATNVSWRDGLVFLAIAGGLGVWLWQG
jgi:hypothetical protein